MEAEGAVVPIKENLCVKITRSTSASSLGPQMHAGFTAVTEDIGGKPITKKK